MQNKYICYGTLLLLCQFNNIVLVRTNRHKVSEVAKEKILVRRHENDIQSCFDNFDIHQDKIIRTQDSRDMGAKYINERDVPTRGDCLRLCCETENCDVFVFEEKNPGSCYLFECGTPEDFKCKFTRHRNYTSAVLAVNRHLSELETQIKFTQHEHELTKLRGPAPNPNPSAEPVKSTISPKSKEFLQYGIEPSSNRPQKKGCSRNQFECHSDEECIAIYNACDGIAQCQDGSDEAPELHCPVSQVSTDSPKLDPITVHPTTSNEGLREPLNIASDNRATSVNVLLPPVQKQWPQHLAYPGAEGNSQIIKNDDVQKPPALTNQGGNSPNRANYGREGEGNPNYHPEQQPWNYQYHQNPGSSQIFTHKGNGLIPQTDRYIQQHPYVPQDIPPRNNVGQQYNDQPPYYYESIPSYSPYRMYGQNPPQNKWQAAQQQPHVPGTLVDETLLNHADLPSLNNPPVPDYYYEDAYRNRGQPYLGQPPLYGNQPKHLPHQNKEEANVQESNIATHEENKSNNDKPSQSRTTVKPTPQSHAQNKENSHAHHSHRKVSKLNAESDAKEVLLFDLEVDGHNNSPSGAILSLTMGLCLTAFMVVIVGCRMKMVRRRMRRGGKSSYAHDADFLVNGMYL